MFLLLFLAECARGLSGLKQARNRPLAKHDDGLRRPLVGLQRALGTAASAGLAAALLVSAPHPASASSSFLGVYPVPALGTPATRSGRVWTAEQWRGVSERINRWEQGKRKEKREQLAPTTKGQFLLNLQPIYETHFTEEFGALKVATDAKFKAMDPGQQKKLLASYERKLTMWDLNEALDEITGRLDEELESQGKRQRIQDIDAYFNYGEEYDQIDRKFDDESGAKRAVVSKKVLKQTLMPINEKIEELKLHPDKTKLEAKDFFASYPDHPGYPKKEQSSGGAADFNSELDLLGFLCWYGTLYTAVYYAGNLLVKNLVDGGKK